jgi:hypothetical protein
VEETSYLVKGFQWVTRCPTLGLYPLNLQPEMVKGVKWPTGGSVKGVVSPARALARLRRFLEIPHRDRPEPSDDP